MKNRIVFLLIIFTSFFASLPVWGQLTSDISNQTFIIKFATPVSKQQAEQYLAGQGLSVKRMLKNNMVAVKINSVSLRKVASQVEQTVITSKINSVKQLPQVSDAYPSIRYKKAQVPNDSGINGKYELNNTGQNGGTSDADMDVFEAWDYTTGSSNVIIGIMDTGIDYDHPDLTGNKWVNTGEIPGNGFDDDGNGYIDDYYGWDFYNDNNNPKDEDGHGTHVAGIVGAKGNNSIGVSGVAWNCKLMPLKVWGTTDGFFTEDLIAAIEYAEHFGVKIANCSFGGYGFDVPLYDAMINSSIIFICAAGNDSNNNDGVNKFYPASYWPMPNKIAVSSTDKNDYLSSFSNYGQSSVDVAAPGSNILSTRPTYSVSGDADFNPPGNNLSASEYGILSGTSMAAPQVAGIVALVLSVAPNLTISQIVDTIRSNMNSNYNSTLSGKVWTSGRINANDILGAFRKSIFVTNSFPGGTVKVQNVTRTTPYTFTEWVGNIVRLDAISPQVIGGITYQFLNWNNSVFTSTHFLTISSGATWTANFSTGKSVTLANKDENNLNLNGTTLKADNSIDVNSNTSILLSLGSHTIKTNHEVVSQNGNLKHNKWNATKTEFKTAHTITVNSASSTQDIAVFKKIETASIVSTLDGFTLNNPIEVKDPWFVETNGTQQENWKSYPTGFTPATMPNGGIFLNEGGSISSLSYPYYSSRISSATTTLVGTDAWFKNWSGPAGSIASPTSLETAVIFKSANDVIKANYKGHLRTGAPELGDPVNQRRLVYDGYYQLMVYESMGEIWATWYNGTTWRQEVRLSNGNGNAKNPSLSNINYGYYDNRAVATWLEGGQVIIQPLEWSNSFTELRLTWNDTPGSPSRDYTTLASAGVLPRTDSRPVLDITIGSNGDIQIWYAVEEYNFGIASGLINLANSTGHYTFATAEYRSFGLIGSSTQVSLQMTDQYPVLINQPAAFGYPEKKAIYFLAAGYASGKRIAEYNRSTDVTTVFPVNNNEYTFYSLSGGVNPTSASYVITATALINSVNSTEIYTKSTYMTGIPTLNKIYTNASKPALMVQNTSAFGSPVYEVNFQQGTNWYKATGGASLTLIGSNMSGIFAREQVGANDRKSVFVKTNASPASLVLYSGSGVLNKGESVLYADVRSVRNYTTLNGQSKTVILDFAGALVEPVDSLENGSSICAVKLIAPDQNTIIVRQPDSIKTALAIDLIRNGISVRSYSSSLWDELSINSFEDVQDGDVLVFRLGFPVVSSWGYEIYDFNGTSLTKNEEETADAVKLKKQGDRGDAKNAERGEIFLFGYSRSLREPQCPEIKNTLKRWNFRIS